MKSWNKDAGLILNPLLPSEGGKTELLVVHHIQWQEWVHERSRDQTPDSALTHKL